MATPQEDEQTGTGAAAPGVLSRHPAAIALGGGVAAAFGSSFIPMNAIEGFVTAYGIAELLPAAAPPLGDTARLALSAGIGTLTAGALLALLPRAESEDMGFETAIRKADTAGKDAGEDVPPAAKSGKLAGWLRTLRFGKAEPVPGTITDFADLAPPRIRNGDQHPDAPVRAPIRANADLGAPLVARTTAPEVPLELGDTMAVESPIATPLQADPSPPPPSLRFAPPSFSEPGIEAFDLVEELPTIEAASEPERVVPSAEPTTPVLSADDAPLAPYDEGLTDEPLPSMAVSAPETPVSLQEQVRFAVPPVATQIGDLDDLSVPELLARLETGLARRREQALGEPAATAAPAARGQIFSMPQTPVSDSDDSPLAKPFGMRLSDSPELPATQAADSASSVDPIAPISGVDAFRSKPIWDEEVEYLPPSVPGNANSLSSTEAVAAEADSSAEPVAPATAEDDDMDAALRDALATLRQLSDRQRGG